MLKQRHAMATTEEDYEQTDCPKHGHLSITGDYSYRAWGEMKREGAIKNWWAGLDWNLGPSLIGDRRTHSDE
jgi:hypothetical protein